MKAPQWPGNSDLIYLYLIAFLEDDIRLPQTEKIIFAGEYDILARSSGIDALGRLS